MSNAVVRHPSGLWAWRRTTLSRGALPHASNTSRRHRRPGTPTRTIRLSSCRGGLETELVQPAERGQVWASEGSVRQVEVFQAGSVQNLDLRNTSTRGWRLRQPLGAEGPRPTNQCRRTGDGRTRPTQAQIVIDDS